MTAVIAKTAKWSQSTAGAECQAAGCWAWMWISVHMSVWGAVCSFVLQIVHLVVTCEELKRNSLGLGPQGARHHVWHCGSIWALSAPSSMLAMKASTCFFFSVCCVSHLSIMSLKINRLVLTRTSWPWLNKTKQMFPIFFLFFFHCFWSILTTYKCSYGHLLFFKGLTQCKVNTNAAVLFYLSDIQKS